MRHDPAPPSTDCWHRTRYIAAKDALWWWRRDRVRRRASDGWAASTFPAVTVLPLPSSVLIPGQRDRARNSNFFRSCRQYQVPNRLLRNGRRRSGPQRTGAHSRSMLRTALPANAATESITKHRRGKRAQGKHSATPTSESWRSVACRHRSIRFQDETGRLRRESCDDAGP